MLYKDFECPLCGDYKRDIKTSGIVKYMGRDMLNDSFIYVSDNFFLIPGPGSIVPGYLILITNDHYTKFSDLNTEMLNEAENIYKKVMNLSIFDSEGKYILFEHGSGEDFNGSACITHAHVHLMPVKNFDNLRANLKKNYPEKMLLNFESLSNIKSKEPYIFISDGNKNYYYETPIIESQYLRKLISVQWGVPDKWDWRINPMKENYLLTIMKYKDKF